MTRLQVKALERRADGVIMGRIHAPSLHYSLISSLRYNLTSSHHITSSHHHIIISSSHHITSHHITSHLIITSSHHHIINWINQRIELEASRRAVVAFYCRGITIIARLPAYAIRAMWRWCDEVLKLLFVVAWCLPMCWLAVGIKTLSTLIGAALAEQQRRANALRGCFVENRSDPHRRFIKLNPK